MHGVQAASLRKPAANDAGAILRNLSDPAGTYAACPPRLSLGNENKARPAVFPPRGRSDVEPAPPRVDSWEGIAAEALEAARARRKRDKLRRSAKVSWDISRILLLQFLAVTAFIFTQLGLRERAETSWQRWHTWRREARSRMSNLTKQGAELKSRMSRVGRRVY